MTEFEVEVWLNGFEEKAVTMTIEAVPPLTPLNVRDWACSVGGFRWSDYNFIRFRRLKNE